MSHTQAEKIANSGQVPQEYEEATDEMRLILTAAFDEYERIKGTEVEALRYVRDENKEVVLNEDSTPQYEQVFDEAGDPVMEMHPLEHRVTHHGLHTYRYEEQSDGSVLALYNNTPDGQIKMKAFANMEEASLWSPRNEREKVTA